MSRTIRSTRRGNASVNDWFNGFDPSRDGQLETIRADKHEMRNQRRRQRHEDRRILSMILHNAADADNVVYADRRRNVYGLPSW